MLRLFSEQHALWQRAVAAMAHLDALMSLAGAAALSDGPMCRPEFVHQGPSAAGSVLH
jgi:DNA mismatch repair ATPase MutS